MTVLHARLAHTHYHTLTINPPGMELYPRIGPFDLKTWTNCSMGMMSWAVLPLCFAVKQYQDIGYVSNSMLVSVVLQQIYVFKFFLYVWWMVK